MRSPGTCPFRKNPVSPEGRGQAVGGYVKKSWKESPANHIVWINIVLNNIMRWNLCVLRYVQESYSNIFSESIQVDRKKPPSGGFSIYYVPWARAVCKRFHDEMRRSHLVVKSFTHGSWSGIIGSVLAQMAFPLHAFEIRVGLTRISSQLPVSDLGEGRHICHFFRWQKMWRVTFVTFLGRMWRSRARKYVF